MNEAKEIFLKYGGSYFHMERDGQLTKYKDYDIDERTEKVWLREYQEEIIAQLLAGNSIDVYLTRLCSVMRQIKDDEYLEMLFNTLEESLKNADTFIKLRIAEELQEVINYFDTNNIGDMKKLANYKNLTIDILRKVISEPIVISENTRKNVAFEDTLRAENIRHRAEQTLKELE